MEGGASTASSLTSSRSSSASTIGVVGMTGEAHSVVEDDCDSLLPEPVEGESTGVLGVRERWYPLDEEPDDDTRLSKLGGVRIVRFGIGKCSGCDWMWNEVRRDDEAEPEAEALKGK